jgi:hypothetical protein
MNQDNPEEIWADQKKKNNENLQQAARTKNEE